MARTYVEKIAEELHIPIIDAKSPARVMVTSTDVVLAQKANSRSCALARASIRLPGVLKAFFFRTTAYLKFKDRFERYLLPPSAQKEIVCFDRTKTFAPGDYQLTPPSPSKNRAVTADYRAKRAKKPASPTENVAPVTAKTNSKPTAKGSVGHGPAKPALRSRVAGRIPALAEQPKKYHHRTQYVRDARDPR